MKQLNSYKMKANKFFPFMVVILLSFCSITKVLAQQHIDKIVDELEKKGVNVNTVVKRNSKKEVYFTSKTLTFISKEGNYARQLENAFDKDSENAATVTKNKNGSSTRYTLIFNENKKKSIYVMNVSGKKTAPTVSFSVSCRDRAIQANKDDWEADLFDFSTTLNDLPKTLDSVSRALKNMDFHKFKFSDEMKKGFNDALDSIHKIDWDKLKQKINDAIQEEGESSKSNKQKIFFFGHNA